MTRESNSGMIDSIEEEEAAAVAVAVTLDYGHNSEDSIELNTRTNATAKTRVKKTKKRMTKEYLIANLNNSKRNNQNSQDQTKIIDPATTTSTSTPSTGDKMSPGLAKRIQPSSETADEFKSQLITSTCSSNSSSTTTNTNNTLTPASSSSTNSSATNSIHSNSINSPGGNNANQIKIQNALDRNMQRLNLNKCMTNTTTTAKGSASSSQLTQEEMELFSGTTPATTTYFSGDSLSSTPEHHNKNGQSRPQEFILNQQIREPVRGSEQQLSDITDPVCSQDYSDYLANRNSSLSNQTNSLREMTPDSINNDQTENDEEPILTKKITSHVQNKRTRYKIPTNHYHNRNTKLSQSVRAKINNRTMPLRKSMLNKNKLQNNINNVNAPSQSHNRKPKKVMPVVEEGLSNDELEDYQGHVYYEEENEGDDSQEDSKACQVSSFVSQVASSIKQSQMQAQAARPKARGENNKDTATDTDEETNNLLAGNSGSVDSPTSAGNQVELVQHDQNKNREINVRQIMDPDNQVLIEGVLFRARYLGSTQLNTDGNPTKLTRMLQAQEAVGRIKAPEGESQPCTDVDLFVSTEKIMVLNTDLQDEKLEIMMDHSLRSISYIADIGNLVVLMAKRRQPTPSAASSTCQNNNEDSPKRAVKMICHVFESDEAQIVAQSIGQAFQVAYMEYLKANGIEDLSLIRDLDYQEVLNQQEIMGDELGMFAKKEYQKEVIIPKAKSEMLGLVIVESGWGSMLPTVVVANMMPTGPAARCGTLNIGDQIISVNGMSMVGLPIQACQTQIKGAKHLTLVRLVVVPCPPVVEVLIKRPDTKYQLGFSVQDGIICSLLRGGIAERGGVRVGHRIIEINGTSVVATSHEKIVNILANSVGQLRMKTMPTQMFRLLTGQEAPIYI